MNNRLFLEIPVPTAIEVARRMIRDWLEPLNLLGLVDIVFYKWMLFQRKQGVSFRFFSGDQSIVHNGGIITVHDPEIFDVNLRREPHDLRINDAVNTRGVSIEMAVRQRLAQICRFNNPDIINPILYRIMSRWMELPGAAPDIQVRFEFNADAGQIDVIQENHRSISPIPMNLPEN